MACFRPALTSVTLALAFVSPLFSQQNLVPPALISDDVAFTALFFVARDAPPPHWDRATVINWLGQRGIVDDDAVLVIKIASKFYEKHVDIETRLGKLNKESQNSLSKETVAKRKAIESEAASAIAASRSELMNSSPLLARQKIAPTIAEIKQNIKMKAN
jgi:hypothetical protein